MLKISEKYSFTFRKKAKHVPMGGYSSQPSPGTITGRVPEITEIKINNKDLKINL